MRKALLCFVIKLEIFIMDRIIWYVLDNYLQAAIITCGWPLFVFQGGYAIIRQWLNSENPEPASEIAGLLRYVGGKMK